MTAIRHRLLGLAAALLLAGPLFGLLALLLATAPTSLPRLGSWDQILGFLAGPDDGTLAWLAIWAVGWVVWAILAGLIVTEVTAAIRGFHPPRLPGFGWPQHLVRDLVATAALMVVATPVLAASFTPVAAAQPTPSQPVAAPSAQPERPSVTKPKSVEYVVQRGDSLWRIAERQLGDGNRYPAIVDLNSKLLRRGPDFIREGWTLKLPAIKTSDDHKSDAHKTYIVREGDNLSKIALKELGDAHAWPKIADASRHIVQPDGRRLTDPDQIDVGWTLHIPTRSNPEHTKDTAPEKQDAAPSEESATPTPASPSPTPSPTSSATTPTTTTTIQPETTPTAQPTLIAPEPSGSTEAAADDGPEAGEDDRDPAWMLLGLTGAGALLGGALWRVVAKNRARQLRHRRPGRFPSRTDPQLVPVERSVHLAAGTGAEEHVEHLDYILKALATTLAFADQPMPQVSAVQLNPQGVTLHLAQPVERLAELWTGEGDSWFLPHELFPQPDSAAPAEQAAPYPLLVTVGSDDGGIWLINPEQFGTLTISGDTDYAHDLARHVTTQIAVNPWSEDARVECIGVAGEVRPVNPLRLHHHEQPTPLVDMVTEAVEHAERLDQTDAADAPTARATDAGYDTWHGRLILLAHQHANLAQPLRELVTGRLGRTGAAVVLLAPEGNDDSRLHLNLTSHGRLDVPELGLNLEPVGLTSDEATGFAQLVEQTNVLHDAPIPVHADAVGWESLADVTGAIRAEHTLPRESQNDPSRPAISILPEPDEVYLSTAATTADDLYRLAPKVTEETAKSIAEIDPTLDADLAEWNDPTSPRPKLRLLGPVSLQLGRNGEPAAADTGKAALLELLAFLATRSRGATTQQVAEAMNVAEGTVRSKVGKLREWLGKDPTTGQDYVPLMHQTDIAKTTGIPAYQLRGVLVDADLFRRLHLRGKTRGPAGIDDLTAALDLVSGEPLTGFKDRRGNWVYEGDRPDQQYVVAIADVAHIVATAALEAGDRLAARQAALVAIKASPAEDIARRDFEAAGGDLSSEANSQASLFSDDEDWPSRTRSVEECQERGIAVGRAAG